MSAQRSTSRAASGTRQPWLIFWGASACVLVVCFLAVLQTSGTTSAGLVLLGGPIDADGGAGGGDSAG